MINFFFFNFFSNDGIMYLFCLQVLTCTLVRDCCCSCCMFSFALLFLIFICLLAVYVSSFAVLFVIFSLYATFVFFYDNSHVSQRCIYCVTWLKSVRISMFHRMRRRRTSVIPEFVIKKLPVTTCPDIVIIESCGEPKLSLGIADN